MREIKARTAYYKNVYYRSRLEATWAAFFDAHDMEAVYEQRAFEFVDGTRYLPDFWLPQSRAWVEVKGVLTDADRDKVLKLARGASLNDEQVILAGTPAGMVAGFVSPRGELDLSLSWERCYHCDAWTSSLAKCRHCGWFEETHVHCVKPTFIQSCAPGAGCGPRCRGAFIWEGDKPIGADPQSPLHRIWAAESINDISRGLKITGRGIR